jgi:lysozyme
LVWSEISKQVVKMINDKGLTLLKDFEGFSPEPYKDIAGVWTIGFGSIYGSDSKRVTKEHKSLTREEALKLVERDLKITEDRIARLVKVEVNENQFSALCSFVYNIGSGAFQRSTARMKLNRKNYKGCADEFLRWKYANKRIIPGLLRRRKAERNLFLNEELSL